MRNKSLVFKPCDPNTLCGINVRFQTVSPTQGQVAHALLTRPPLGIATSFDLNVLCTPPAFILSQDQTLEQIVSQPFPVKIFYPSALALFYFLEYGSMLVKAQNFFSRNFREIRTRFLLVLISPVVQLSMINQPHTLAHSLTIISQRLALVNRFLKVFSNFFKLRIGWDGCPGGQLVHYSIIPLICQGFFCVFFSFGGHGILS